MLRQDFVRFQTAPATRLTAPDVLRSTRRPWIAGVTPMRDFRPADYFQYLLGTRHGIRTRDTEIVGLLLYPSELACSDHCPRHLAVRAITK